MKKRIQIEGMNCMHCVKHVTTALNEVEGVSQVVVNLKQNDAVIEVSENVQNDVLKNAISEAGYTAKTIEVL
ncbi:heavy-metal-associated domain-containing protein [Paracholeplasma manati]|uniref:Copper ion binding protein n=1 Tax=Paracholeplasma manati TaxID=591373 RepID=A0ABT2Y6D1_9MOLU|nr:copper ion binding protein [Paracholeplasma manati]MCV2232304.1 copper ion binding protein [Paracholeplasma manati]MDG0888261.1 copper ion binding protein [Paracholeplasma manati]